MKDKYKTAAIILAAGESSRMGQPKQLLTLDHQTLLQQSIATALAAECDPVVVVLGAHADLIRPTIAHQPVTITYNEQWKEGMGGSIRTGVRQLTAMSTQTEAAIIMLCDQPLVDPSLLQKLIHEHQSSGKLIVASQYQDVLGVPALFHHSLFEQLSRLKQETGARKLIREYEDHTQAVPFAGGSIDLDTAKDYQNYLHRRDDKSG